MLIYTYILFAYAPVMFVIYRPNCSGLEKNETSVSCCGFSAAQSQRSIHLIFRRWEKGATANIKHVLTFDWRRLSLCRTWIP